MDYNYVKYYRYSVQFQYCFKEFMGSGQILPVCTLSKYDIGAMLLHTYGLKTTIAWKKCLEKAIYETCQNDKICFKT